MLSQRIFARLTGAGILSTFFLSSALATTPVANPYEFKLTAPQSVSVGKTISFVATVKPEYSSSWGFRFLLIYPDKYLSFEPMGSDPLCEAVIWSYGSVVCDIKPSEARTLTVKFKAIGKPCNDTQIAVQQEFGASDATEEVNKEYMIDYAGSNAPGCTANADLAVTVQEPVKGRSLRAVSVESVIENTGAETAENAVLRLWINPRVYAPRRASIRVNGQRVVVATTPESCDESTGTCDSTLLIPLGSIRSKEKKIVDVPFRLRQRCKPDGAIIAHFTGEGQTTTPDANKSNNFGWVTFYESCPILK
jgi:hypothetical protein